MPSLDKSKATVKIVIRCTKEDREAIAQKAKAFTKNNISQWIRYASISHTPKK